MNDTKRQSLEYFAERLAYALGHGSVPQDIKNSLVDIFDAAYCEADYLFHNPEFVESVYPLVIENLSDDYGRGVHFSIKSIIDTFNGRFEGYDDSHIGKKLAVEESEMKFGTLDELEGDDLALAVSALLNNPNLPVEIWNGIKRGMAELETDVDLDQITDTPEYIAKVFKLAKGENVREETAKVEPVLDLSDQPENLNILAEHLSAVMKNPLTPTRIYNCLANELTSVFVDTDTPENILANLKNHLANQQIS